jgi:predicted nucleotidyltransferase
LARQTSKDRQAEGRHKIAKEAATLLYFGLEKEYKQAKMKARENFGSSVLPSNLEVALELDKFAEETEGPERLERLVRMRIDALKVMKILNSFYPVLIGSVWRGTIRRGSDIDIEAYCEEPEEVVMLLKAGGMNISRTERMSTTEHGKIETSLHIHAESLQKHPVEVVVRPFEEAGKKRICDIFGDQIKGLNVRALEKLLEKNPAQTFIPN